MPSLAKVVSAPDATGRRRGRDRDPRAGETAMMALELEIGRDLLLAVLATLLTILVVEWWRFRSGRHR
jgi:hypothetical protein